MDERIETNAQVVKDMLDIFHDYLSSLDVDPTNEEVLYILFSFIATVGGYTGTPDLFLKDFKTLIDYSLNSGKFDQVMTKFTNEINEET